ncbi:hypothetical protein [Candidatus Palauibacter sp.]|uniref:hypothetical protein n=1 Tax=Candidatus Palauibacter sp. TaxID=3101350 RepID=UPI003B5243DB
MRSFKSSRLPVCQAVGGIAFSLAATAVPAIGQEAIRRGEIDLAIGVMDGAQEYLFENVRALTRDAAGRIYVGDGGARDVRVYGPEGRYLFHVTGPGEGPGELRWDVCGLTFEGEGLLWVDAWNSYEVFGVTGDDAEHVRQVLPPHLVQRVGEVTVNRATLCEKPMFTGPTGLTFATDYFYLDDEGEIDAERLLVSVASDGEIRNRVTIPERDLGDTSWPVAVWRHPNRGREEMPVAPPFYNRNILVHAPDARSAHLYTREYLVQLFDANGEVRREIRRDIAGPLVTEAEARRERERLDARRGSFGDMLIEFPSIEMPERKPPVGDMWYDEDGRLWVRLAWAEADEVLRAHVYDPEGEILFTAEWPRGIDLTLGGVSGDVALGVQRMEFDVQRVVRLRFSPR